MEARGLLGFSAMTFFPGKGNDNVGPGYRGVTRTVVQREGCFSGVEHSRSPLHLPPSPRRPLVIGSLSWDSEMPSPSISHPSGEALTSEWAASARTLLRGLRAPAC